MPLPQNVTPNKEWTHSPDKGMANDLASDQERLETGMSEPKTGLPLAPRQNRSNACSAPVESRPAPSSTTSMRASDPLAVDPDLDRSRLRRVHPRVRQEIGEHLPDSRLVTEERNRFRSDQFDRSVRFDRPEIVHGVSRDLGKIEIGELQRAALVEASEREEVVDQHPHASRLVPDPLERPLLRGRIAQRAGLQQLGVPADRRERCPQLVRRVGDERAQRLLR